MHSLRLAHRELVPTDPNSPLTLRDARASHFSYPWHYHPEIELALVVSGRGLRYVGDSIHTFEDGDLCLVGPGIPHCWLSKPAPGQARALVVQFLPQVFGESFLQLSAAQPIVRLLERAGRGLRLHGALHSRISEATRQLFTQAPRPLDQLAQLMGILARIADSEECETLSLSSNHRPETPRHIETAQRVLTHIHSNALRPMSQRVAVNVGRSAS